MAVTNGRSYGVLVIDMQTPYLWDIGWYRTRRLIKNQKSVLEFCVEQDIPVIDINVARTESTIEKIRESLNRVPRLIRLWKEGDDGFRNENLEIYLRAWSVSNLCLMGVYGANCVYATARSAKEKGFKIVTSGEIIEDRSRKRDDSWYIKNGMYFKKTKDLIAHMRPN